MRRIYLILAYIFAVLLSGCSLLSPQQTIQIGTPSSGTPQPAAQVRFVVSAPQGTPDEAELTFVLLDPVTELDFNAQRFPMNAEGDGQWSVVLTPAAGSLLYYRFEKKSPDVATEVTSQGALIDYRVTYISAPSEIHDRIARWSGEEYSGETGRILGQLVSAQDDQPLNEMLVSAGGLITFTDGEGRFRLDGLPPGLHTITAFSPTGNYLPQKQEALIATKKTTPVALKLKPAKPLVVTFQVTVPPETPEQATLRLVGNLAQLGFRFAQSDNGPYLSISQMPELVRVDPEHFLGVFTLYAGSNLYYKYTLGDGVWNAERAMDGSFTTRSATLHGDNPTLRDTVESWSDGSGEPTRFEVAIPDYTPPGDHVSIQFKAGTWRTPIPMWNQDALWSFALYGPESLQEELEYRYCRNMQCGAADESGFTGMEASGRPLGEGLRGTAIQDVVDQWQWLDRSAPFTDSTTDPQLLEYLKVRGVEFSSDFDPYWMKHLPEAFDILNSTGANEVILKPAWVWSHNNPFPVLELDPNQTPLNQELNDMLLFARDHGMRVSLRPSLLSDGIDIDSWWLQADRDRLWWDLWFEEYRSFVLSYARWASQHGVERLILGGPEVFPALPFASLPNATPSGVPANSEQRWRDLIGEVREHYSGQLSFELEVQDGLSPIPPFIELFDQVHLYWHSPILDDDSVSQEIILATIEGQINAVLEKDIIVNKPISISLAYLSLEDSGAACPPQPDGSCRSLQDFARGQIVDIDLQVDLQAQARIFESFLQAIADEPQIEGFFAHGFYPAVILHDKSASIYGKPAQQVLAKWFESPTR